MEVTVVHGHSGESLTLCVACDATLGDLIHDASAGLGCLAGGVLLSDGISLQDHHALGAPLSDIPGLEAGCSLVLQGGVQHFLEDVRNGKLAWADLPPWLQVDASCAHAALQVDPCAYKEMVCHHSNKDITTDAVMRYHANLKHASEALQDDTDVVQTALRTSCAALQYASLRLRSDPDLAVSLLEQRRQRAPHDMRQVLRSAAPQLLGDRDFALRALVLTMGEGLELFSPALHDDSEVVMCAAVRCPGAFPQASSRLRGDRSFMALLLKKITGVLNPVVQEEYCTAQAYSTTCLLSSTSEELRDDREIVLAAVGIAGCSLGAASDTLRMDKQIVTTAMQNGGDFAHAHETLKADRSFILKMLPHYTVLRYASADLRADREVVFAAVKVQVLALSYADRALLADKKFMLRVIRAKGFGYLSCAPSLQGDEEVALTMLKKDPSAFRTFPPNVRTSELGLSEALFNAVPKALLDNKVFVIAALRKGFLGLSEASPRLCDDEDVVLVAVKNSGYELRHASPRLRGTLKVVEASVASTERGPTAIALASEELQRDEAFTRRLLLKNPLALKSASDHPLRVNRAFMRSVVSKQGDALASASHCLRHDHDFVLSAVRSSGLALAYASEALQGDLEIACAAVQQNRAAFAYVPQRIRTNPKLVQLERPWFCFSTWFNRE